MCVTQVPDSPLLLCLLPVRDAAPYLPRFFDALRPFCDAVIALDDGSSDKTPEILRSEPLVKKILTHPNRGDYTGWNDASNRNELLRSARDLRPTWIISLDADEVIDREDGLALRHFLQNDAIPGLAYGFRNAPMEGDLCHFVPTYVWVYRLFAYEQGQRFPARKLHFVPIPTLIPPDRWIKTTIRIKHLGEMSPARRLARFAKYLEADPNRKYQASYEETIALVPASLRRAWLRRPESLSPLLSVAEAAITTPAQDEISFSVVILGAERDGLRATISSVLQQQLNERFELLVLSSTPQVSNSLKMNDSRLTFVDAPIGASVSELLNLGVERSEGTFVLFVRSGETIADGCLNAYLNAHRRGYMMVSGRYLAQSHSRLARSRDILTYGRQREGKREALAWPPTRCSYARLALHEAGGFPSNPGLTDPETPVNQELFRRGYLAFYEPEAIILYPAHNGWSGFFRQAVERGRRNGNALIEDYRQTGGMLSVPNFEHVKQRLNLVDWQAPRRLIHNRRPSMKSNNFLVSAAAITGKSIQSISKWVEVVRPEQEKSSILFTRRAQLLLIGTVEEDKISFQLAQMDYERRRRTAVPLKVAPVFEWNNAHHKMTFDDLVRNAFRNPARQRALNARTLASSLSTVFGVSSIDVIIASRDDATGVWGAIEGAKGSLRQTRAARRFLASPSVICSLSPSQLISIAKLTQVRD